MKIIKLLCVLLLVLFPSSSLFSQSLICTLMGMRCPVKMEDLLERKGLYYKPFSEKPFTGKVSGLQRGKISSGKKEGEWITFDDRGQLITKANFQDGVLHGFYEGMFYTRWGSKREVSGLYKEGLKVGQWKEGDAEGHYLNGQKNGKWTNQMCSAVIGSFKLNCEMIKKERESNIYYVTPDETKQIISIKKNIPKLKSTKKTKREPLNCDGIDKSLFKMRDMTENVGCTKFYENGRVVKEILN